MNDLPLKLAGAVSDMQKILDGLRQDLLNYSAFLDNEIARLQGLSDDTNE